MDKNLMDALYVEHDGKIGVLSSDERKVVSQVVGTDLTLVYDKKEGNTYLLIPLTRNHKFECKSSHIIVDGKRFDSDIFFRKNGCQWIQMQSKEMLLMVA
jgi:hypothetical protein